MNNHPLTPPTPQAVRAANAVATSRQNLMGTRSTTDDDRRAAEALAAVIDREANLPALLRSHAKLMEALGFYMSICGNTAYSVTRESAQQAYAMGRTALQVARDTLALTGGAA